MRDYPVKAPGDTFSSEEFNESIGGELENFITKAGIALAALTTNQMSQAATLYTGASTFFLESGVADAYVGNVISPFEAPPSLPDGFVARFFPGNTNTGASTLNLTGTGVKAIVKDAGLVALTGGEIVVNEPLIVQYDLGTDQWQIILSGFQIGAGGAGAVDSVFGRTGTVLPVLDDYAASLVDNDSSVPGDTVKDALETLNASVSGGLIGYRVFTSSTTYTPTAGTTSIKVTVTGGGGGREGSGNGGTSSLGALLSATGGLSGSAGDSPGVGSGGDLNLSGGGNGNASGNRNSQPGGASIWGSGPAKGGGASGLW